MSVASTANRSLANSRRTVAAIFVTAGLLALAGAAAMWVWVIFNAMSHSGLGYWSLWYGGASALLVASLLWLAAAVTAKRGLHRSWIVIVCAILSAASGIASGWAFLVQAL